MEIVTKTIKFNTSFATWLAKDQKSYGRFTIESACKFIQKGPSRIIEHEYYLLSKVMAGNVYAKEKLIKEPTYEFSSIFSQNEYKIIRNFETQQEIHDNYGSVGELFKKVDFSINYSKGRILETFDEIADATLGHHRINARIELELQHESCEIILEFPVKHINIQTDIREYQVETGPILVPKAKKNKNINIDDLSVAYIAFNKSNDACFATFSSTVISGQNKRMIRFFSTINYLKINTYLISH